MSKNKLPRIGVLGAGQLGRMLALAGIPLGFSFNFYDTNSSGPTDGLGILTQGDFNDFKALKEFAKSVDVVTFESENIPMDAAEAVLESTMLLPHSTTLAITQDRLHEKNLCLSLGIKTAPFVLIESAEDFENVEQILGDPPWILKSRRMGYDGKGQIVVNSKENLSEDVLSLIKNSCVLEKKISFSREWSIILSRSPDGGYVFYPLTENKHSDGILRLSKVFPSTHTSSLNLQARSISKAIATKLGFVGTIAIEFFEYKDTLIVNEIAPRVHNSGHWTIEGAVTSQFQNHLRAITGLPLGDSLLNKPAAMINLIGKIPAHDRILQENSCYLHVYGKEPREGRKVGHITIIKDTEEEVTLAVERLQKVIG